MSSDAAGLVMADAVVTLVQYRGQLPGEAGAALQALADLVEAGTASIPEAVADARAMSYSWDHIAAVLGIQPDVAKRRYGPYSKARRCPELDH
jgi:hypothetical protein